VDGHLVDVPGVVEEVGEQEPDRLAVDLDDLELIFADRVREHLGVGELGRVLDVARWKQRRGGELDRLERFDVGGATGPEGRVHWGLPTSGRSTR
jgi:hypothetical protein